MFNVSQSVSSKLNIRFNETIIVLKKPRIVGLRKTTTACERFITLSAQQNLSATRTSVSIEMITRLLNDVNLISANL